LSYNDETESIFKRLKQHIIPKDLIIRNEKIMTLSHFAIQGLVPYITGDFHAPKRSGRNLVALFNSFGSRDVYTLSGLPVNPKRKDGQGMSRKEYVEDRLLQLSGNDNLRMLLEQVLNEADDKVFFQSKFNELIESEGFNVTEGEGHLTIQGGTINRNPPVQNEAHFRDIQDRILAELNNSRVSIRLAMAWFTNDTLFNKLVEKNGEGIDVQLLIYNDEINRIHGVNITLLDHRLKRATRGGTMHNKFCVIDNQVVITGSYNWTNNAETRNDENITIERDPALATAYSQEFRRLRSVQNPEPTV
jgi:hypothetical protein